ncbi:MAG: universal stress protein [Bacillota bacterium]
MKILACTDGSENSRKALEKASLIAAGCNVSEVAVIHVYQPTFNFSTSWEGRQRTLTEEEIETLRKLHAEEREERKEIMKDAVDLCKGKNIIPCEIMKEGPVAHTIVTTAREEGFDTIVIGSRGLGGLKKLFLGSVSSAVVQEAQDCSVLVVK